jgi:hypothetical protein
MKKVIALTSTLFAASIISVAAAIASPTSVTTSGQPAAWKTSETQPNSAPANPVSQPSGANQNQPVDAPDKREVKSIDAQVLAVPRANQCTGDARFSNPPVVNNPHHIRNVVWRNMRAMCAN